MLKFPQLVNNTTRGQAQIPWCSFPANGLKMIERSVSLLTPRVNTTRAVCGGGGCLQFNSGCELHKWEEGVATHVPIVENKDS